MNLGDLLLASSIVMSGNHYFKIDLLAKFLNLSMFSYSTFYRIQMHYTISVIKSTWNDILVVNIEKAKSEEVLVTKGMCSFFLFVIDLLFLSDAKHGNSFTSLGYES